MTLDEALEKVETIRANAERTGRETPEGSLPQRWACLDEEALRVVLAAARENHSARLVAETNALSAKALEMARNDSGTGRGLPGRVCAGCGDPQPGPHGPMCTETRQ